MYVGAQRVYSVRKERKNEKKRETVNSLFSNEKRNGQDIEFEKRERSRPSHTNIHSEFRDRVLKGFFHTFVGWEAEKRNPLKKSYL